MGKYVEGQRWSYQTREQDVGSTLLIGKIQCDSEGRSIIHVSVDSVVTPTSDHPVEISHMPFSEQAMDSSVLKLIETGLEVTAEFENGFNIWQEQKGGVFDLSVSEAVEAINSIGPANHDDPFDDLVTEMREKQSEELIGELYRQLFALDQWFFLCDPSNPRAPVQWVFPDGMNPEPALLAFTSSQRAASAAGSLEIYSEGEDVLIMPASVKEAVDWVSGPDCENEWICFNFTQENFPLYCADAANFVE